MAANSSGDPLGAGGGGGKGGEGSGLAVVGGIIGGFLAIVISMSLCYIFKICCFCVSFCSKILFFKDSFI